MVYSTFILFALLAAPLAALAAPARLVGKRADSDILVFKFAKVLEDFEAAFYSAALAKFKAEDFTTAGFVSPALAVEQFTAIGATESTHATALEAALKSFGETPIEGCTFNFDAALKDVATMAATARVVEDTGVCAYLGGATLLTDPVLLTAAGSILSVEARHSTVLNILSGTGSSVPSPFDLAMTPSEVLAIAGPFISGCDVGIPANKPLALTNTGEVGPGTKLEFQSEAITDTAGLFCQMTTGGAAFSISLPLDNCVVPEGIDGPVMIHVTSDETPLVNNVRDRATTQQVAGPLLAFIDTKRQALSQLSKGAAPEGGAPPPVEAPPVETPPTASGDETVSTETITPSQASEIIAGATTAAGPEATGAAPVGNASSAPPVSAKPNLDTGLSEDGKIEVEGWTNNV